MLAIQREQKQGPVVLLFEDLGPPTLPDYFFISQKTIRMRLKKNTYTKHKQTFLFV